MSTTNVNATLPALADFARSPSAATVDQSHSASKFAKIGLALYLLFIVSWFLQFARRMPALGAIRLDLLLVMAISAFCVVSASGRPADRRGWTSRRNVFVLLGYALLTVPFVEWPGSVVKTGLPEFFKAAVFCLFTAALVRDLKTLRAVLFAFVGCQMFRVLEPLYLHYTDGYWGSVATMSNWEYMNRLAGAPFDVINPNGLAFVAVTSLAFCHFLLPLTRLGRIVYMIYAPLALLTLALTASRTGMLALAIVLLAIWWKSRHKLVMAAVVTIVLFASIPFLPSDLADRYLSIFSSDTKNAQTATERSQGLVASLKVAARRPFFGHGLGTSREANVHFGIDGQPAHNLYVEAAQELGFVGLPLVIALMATIWAELSGTRAVYRSTGEKGLAPAVADALHVFLLMNLTFSLASYGLSGYEWYMMAGLSGVLARLSTTATPGLVAAPQKPEPAPRLHPALQGVNVAGAERLRISG